MDEWKLLLTDAYARFHAEIEASRASFPGLTPYTASDRSEAVKGTFAWSWGATSEIRETINSINAWGGRLHQWAAWNHVIDSYSTDDERWEVSSHFVEPLAFFCMLQPSSLTDRLILVAETTLHQANQRVYPDEPDRLDQDRLKPGAVLRRSDRKKQLDRLGLRWTTYRMFRNALDEMNNAGYRDLSRNFRDLSTHSFAPRFLLGHVPRATRSIVPWSDLVEQSDGSYLQVKHHTKKAVQYAMNDTPPLSLGQAQAANLDEYRKAQHAMNCFAALIEELCDKMDKVPEWSDKLA